MTDGDRAVLTRRLDALSEAIAAQNWDDVQWIYEQVRSAAERMMRTRARHYDPAEVIADRPAVWADMLTVPGYEMDFEVIRDDEATLRDGLNATLSVEAMEDLHWRMTAFVGSRIMREHERTDLMPQAVRVAVHVELDTQRIADEPSPDEPGDLPRTKTGKVLTEEEIERLAEEAERGYKLCNICRVNLVPMGVHACKTCE